MRVGFLGDVVGRPGREIIKIHLQKARQDLRLDLVVANVENAAGGFGFTEKILQELMACGVDVFTGGNHSFDNKEAFGLFDAYPVIAPANYARLLGKSGVYCAGDLAIINLMGCFGMPMCDNPFLTAQDLVQELLAKGTRKILIDFHAEATSEKSALMRLFEGKVSFIVGTHTHIATDDLIIKDGTGFVSDAGLNGCFDGVIGVAKDEPLEHFKIGIKRHFKIPSVCKRVFQMVVFELDITGKCLSAQKFRSIEDAPLRALYGAEHL